MDQAEKLLLKHCLSRSFDEAGEYRAECVVVVTRARRLVSYCPMKKCSLHHYDPDGDCISTYRAFSVRPYLLSDSDRSDAIVLVERMKRHCIREGGDALWFDVERHWVRDFFDEFWQNQKFNRIGGNDEGKLMYAWFRESQSLGDCDYEKA